MSTINERVLRLEQIIDDYIIGIQAAPTATEILKNQSRSIDHVEGWCVPAYQIRVREEFEVLSGRLNRLTAFLENGPDETITVRDYNLLHSQRDAMGTYAHVLGERIAGF
jgi:hypothetical protein